MRPPTPRDYRVPLLALTIGISCLLLTCRDHPLHPRSPFAVADSLRDEGRFAQMLPVYRALRDSLVQAGDTANLWRAQLWWSEALIRNQRRDSARVALTEALALSRGDPDREGWVRWRWCSLYSGLGQADSAISQCQQAIELARRVADSALEAEAHNQLGTVQSRRGHYRESLSQSEQAVKLWRASRGSAGELANFLNNLAIEYQNLGRLGDAEQAYREGLALARQARNLRAEFFLVGNLAGVRAETGDMDEAERLLNEALRSGEAFPDTQTMVYTRNSLAEYYIGARNLAAARRRLEEALPLTPRVVAYMRLITLYDLGQLELAESHAAPAERWLTAAREVADSLDFGHERVVTRTGLARLALAVGNRAAASRWAQSAGRIADSLGDLRGQLDARRTWAAVLEASGRSDAAGEYLNTLAIIESWRGRLAAGDLRMGIAESYWDVYEGAIRTLLAGGRAAEGFAVAERARARRLLELVSERDASRPAASFDAALRVRLRERYQERDAVDDPGERVALDREIRLLTDSLSRVEAAARDSNPLAAARYPVPAALREVQGRLLRPGRALLTWFWGDSAVYGWWLTPDSVRAVRLGAADSLGALVEFWRQTLATPTRDSLWQGTARHVFRKLVEPLGPTQTEEVLVIADGPLAHVPIEALVPTGSARPWAAARRLVYGPSASVLLAVQEARRESSYPRAMLAVGNPAIGPRAGGPPADDAVRAAGEVLVPLPYAEEEARSIDALFQAAGADLLLGRQATVENWRAHRPARYRYLHFAAHALVSDRRPEQTGLVLAAGDLNLAAIRQLTLRSELVTLSACETGLGRMVRGEGIIGLPHAFLSAGARGVLVSLWRVNDRSTAEFMREFYQQVHAGRTPEEALYRVRLRWLEASGTRAHPFYWAPFILVGGLSH